MSDSSFSSLMGSIRRVSARLGGRGLSGGRRRSGWKTGALRAAAVEQLESRVLLTNHLPNIVLINTDDQRFDSVAFMPEVLAEIAAEGTTFENAFVTTPICCPSRASLLSGQYAHTNGVVHNQAPLGAFQNFDDTSTLATWLDDAGYETGIFGKYMNGYDRFADENADPLDVYIPPGWDEWHAFVGAGYFNYRLANNNVIETYGSLENEYSTDVLAGLVDDFMRANEASDDDPFFVYFAPKNPHVPIVPAPRHVGALDGIALHRPPSFNEADFSDKPAWAQSKLPLLTAQEIADLDAFRQGSLESMLSVDEAIGTFMDTLRELNELDNTVIIFTSDNGHLWGEHRYVNKGVPWDESIRVPLMIYDGRNPVQQSSDALALNIDLGATILDTAGLTVPSSVEGAPLTPFLNGETTETVTWRTDFVVEAYKGDGGRYAGVRSEEWLYVEYVNGDFELYDMVNDPYQLDNRAGDPALAVTQAQLAARLQALLPTDVVGPVTTNLTVIPNSDGLPISFTASVSDATTGASEVRTPEFYIDTIGNDGNGTAMSAVDGKFTSDTEDVIGTIPFDAWNALSLGEHTLYVHGQDTPSNWGSYVSVTFTKANDIPPPLPFDIYYMTFDQAGTAAGTIGPAVNYDVNDILRLVTFAGGDFQYELFFDGSDIGLTDGAEAIDALHIQSDGSIVISTGGTTAVETDYLSPGAGSGATINAVAQDLLKFTPTATGSDTTGSWSLFFDGAAHGLDVAGEDIEALSILDDGSILISTPGQVRVPGQFGQTQDILRYLPATDTWVFYFNGDDVELTGSGESVDALFVETDSGGPAPTLHLSTADILDTTGITSAVEDITPFNSYQLGITTIGNHGPIPTLDGSAFGLTDANIQAMHLDRTEVISTAREVYYLTMFQSGTVTSSDDSTLTFEDSDVIQLTVDIDGSYAYAMYFDGSDAGLEPSAEDIDAIHVLSDGSLVISTNTGAEVLTDYNMPGVGSGATINALRQDLLRFVPISTGGETAGSWSLYFDGITNGLTTDAGNIDGLSVLEDNTLLVSVTGNITLGELAVQDEDVLAFDPVSGNWSLYLDSSDVELISTTEDLGAISVEAADTAELAPIRFATPGAMSVTQVSGIENDVFTFRPTSLGDETAGSFDSPPTLVGDQLGLEGFNVNGLHYRLLMDDRFARFEFAFVEEPTVLDPRGELAALPTSVPWVHEWKEFYVEVYVSTPVATGVGITSATVELDYDTDYFTATEIEYGPALGVGTTGIIDDAVGKVSQLGGSASVTDLDVGDINPALLARVHFAPTAADGTNIDWDLEQLGPYDIGLGLSVLDATFSGSAQSGAIQADEFEVVPPPQSSVYAIPYDYNDDGSIGLSDLVVLASVFGETVSESESPYAWISDFDQSGIVSLTDVVYFAGNFGLGQSDGEAVTLPPEVGESQGLVFASSSLASIRSAGDSVTTPSSTNPLSAESASAEAPANSIAAPLSTIPSNTSSSTAIKSNALPTYAQGTPQDVGADSEQSSGRDQSAEKDDKEQVDNDDGEDQFSVFDDSTAPETLDEFFSESLKSGLLSTF